MKSLLLANVKNKNDCYEGKKNPVVYFDFIRLFYPYLGEGIEYVDAASSIILMSPDNKTMSPPHPMREEDGMTDFSRSFIDLCDVPWKGGAGVIRLNFYRDHAMSMDFIGCVKIPIEPSLFEKDVCTFFLEPDSEIYSRMNLVDKCLGCVSLKMRYSGSVVKGTNNTQIGQALNIVPEHEAIDKCHAACQERLQVSRAAKRNAAEKRKSIDNELVHKTSMRRSRSAERQKLIDSEMSRIQQNRRQEQLFDEQLKQQQAMKKTPTTSVSTPPTSKGQPAAGKTESDNKKCCVLS
eukprot:PhF_6_TR21153/c0_g1_i2/m.30452